MKSVHSAQTNAAAANQPRSPRSPAPRHRQPTSAAPSANHTTGTLVNTPNGFSTPNWPGGAGGISMPVTNGKYRIQRIGSQK